MKRIITLMIALGCCWVAASAQEPPDLQALVEQARGARDLSKLNEVRIKLRQVEYAGLPSIAEKELYAEAYRLLAWSHRNNRYIRPGFDLLAKHIALRDSISEEKRRFSNDSLAVKHRAEAAALAKSLNEMEETEKRLKSEKVLLDRARDSYLVIRIAAMLAILAVSLYFITKFRRRTAVAMRSFQAQCDEMANLNERAVDGRMTAAVLYHARVLNGRIQAEADKLHELMTVMKADFSDMKETEPVMKSANDNLDRVVKLVTLNYVALEKFFAKLPVFKSALPAENE